MSKKVIAALTALLLSVAAASALGLGQPAEVWGPLLLGGCLCGLVLSVVASAEQGDD